MNNYQQKIKENKLSSNNNDNVEQNVSSMNIQEIGKYYCQKGKEAEILICKKLKENPIFIKNMLKEKFPHLTNIDENKFIIHYTNDNKLKEDYFISYEDKKINFSQKGMFNKNSNCSHLGGYTIKSILEKIKNLNLLNKQEIKEFSLLYLIFSDPCLFLKDIDYLKSEYYFIDFSSFDYFGDKTKFFLMLKENLKTKKKKNHNTYYNLALSEKIFNHFFPQQCSFFKEILNLIKPYLIKIAVFAEENIDFLSIYSSIEKKCYFYHWENILSLSTKTNKVYERKKIYLLNNIIFLTRKNSGKNEKSRNSSQFQINKKFILKNISPSFILHLYPTT